jgi:PKD repeat protein
MWGWASSPAAFDTGAGFDFYAYPGWGKPPVRVEFTSMLLGLQDIVEWRWVFGDGTTLEGDEPNPSHTYQDEGVYTVSLTVVDGLDQTATVTRRDFIIVSDALAFDHASILLTAVVVLSVGAVLISRRSKVNKKRKRA